LDPLYRSKFQISHHVSGVRIGSTYRKYISEVHGWRLEQPSSLQDGFLRHRKNDVRKPSNGTFVAFCLDGVYENLSRTNLSGFFGGWISLNAQQKEAG